MIKKIAVIFDNFIYKILIKNLLKTSKLGYGFVVTGAEAGKNYEHIYDNKATGNYIIGKFVDRALLNLPAVRSTRGRKDDIKRILWNEIYKNNDKGVVTRVLDLASGGARYLRELQEEHNQGLIESICVDKDRQSIILGERLAASEGIKNIEFLRANIFKLNHLKRKAKELNWMPNVVIASGLFIYFNDEQVRQMLTEIHGFLEDDSLVVFSSYEKIDSKKLMRKTMATSSGETWTLYYRKPLFWRKFLRDIGYRDVFILRDNWLMNNIIAART